MVDRQRAAIIATRAAEGIPRVQTPDTPEAEPAPAQPARPAPAEASVRISARITRQSRDALRTLGAVHGLSVAALVDLLGTAAADSDERLLALVAARSAAHQRPWGGPR